MNNTLYTDLAPLGFAEWCEKEYYRLGSAFLGFAIQVLQDEDLLKEIIKNGDIRLTMLNALAFRWLREEGIITLKLTTRKLDFKQYKNLRRKIILHVNMYQRQEINLNGLKYHTENDL